MEIEDLLDRLSHLELEKQKYNVDAEKNRDRIRSLQFNISYYRNLILKKQKEKRNKNVNIAPNYEDIEDDFVLISNEEGKTQTNNAREDVSKSEENEEEEDWVLLIPKFERNSSSSEAIKKENLPPISPQRNTDVPNIPFEYPKIDTKVVNMPHQRYVPQRYPKNTPPKNPRVNNNPSPKQLPKRQNQRGNRISNRKNSGKEQKKTNLNSTQKFLMNFGGFFNKKKKNDGWDDNQMKQALSNSLNNNNQQQQQQQQQRRRITTTSPVVKRKINNKPKKKKKEEEDEFLNFLEERYEQDLEFRRKEAEILGHLDPPIESSVSLDDDQRSEFEKLEDQVDEEDFDEGDFIVKNTLALLFPAEEDDEEVSESSLSREWEYLQAEVSRQQDENRKDEINPEQQNLKKNGFVEEEEEEKKNDNNNNNNNQQQQQIRIKKKKKLKMGEWKMSNFEEDFENLKTDLIRLRKIFRMYEKVDVGSTSNNEETDLSLLISSTVLVNKRIEKYKNGKIVTTNLNTGTKRTRFPDGSIIIRPSDGSYVKREIPGKRRESYYKRFQQYQIIYENGDRVVHFLKSKRSEKLFMKNNNNNEGNIRIVSYSNGMRVLMINDIRKEILFANGIRQVSHLKEKIKEIIMPDGKRFVKRL